MLIAGVDEVGYGALAGRVMTAAVILDPNKPILNLKDSKLLTAKQRLALKKTILENALTVSIGHATVEEIDNLNILHATLLAMERAILGLAIIPQQIFIDGKYIPKFNNYPNYKKICRAIIQGDREIPAISAASIVAKVTRDQEMCDYHLKYPNYQFDKHKGYPTKLHQDLLKKFGVTEIHRQSFGPVKLIKYYK